MSTGRTSVDRPARREGATVVDWLVTIALPAALIVAALYPLLRTPFELQLGTLICVYTLAVAGLDVLAGRAGLLHLGFGVVFGAGAYTVAVVAQHWDGPVIASIALGCVVAAIGAALLGALLAQSSRYIFAVLTLAAASTVASVVSNVSWLGGTSGLGGVSRDVFGTGDLQPSRVYILIGVVTLAVLVLYAQFRSTRTGRAIEALRQVPGVAEASGVNLALLRMKLTVLAGVIGGLAGGFYALLQQYVSTDVVGLTQSVNLLAMNIIGGGGIAWAGIPGAVVAVALPQQFESLVAYQLIIVGAVMGLVALSLRRGVAGAAGEHWRRAASRTVPGLVTRRAERLRRPAPDVPPIRASRDGSGTGALEVDDVAVNFGGVHALKGVSLRLEPGVVHALVGPNGSGKSTLVGVIAGSVGATAGRVSVHGQDVTSRRAHTRVGLGITRTFQLVSLCDSLSVLENVMLGGHASTRQRFARDFLALHSRRAERELAARAAAILRELGAEDIAAAMPAVLTSGQQRLVEIARCLMSDAHVILLDEPAAGLSTDERRQLAAVIRRLADRQHAVLLIEHDMDFVMSLADTITVLSEGAVLTRGEPDHVRSDPSVIEAYWGTAAAA